MSKVILKSKIALEASEVLKIAQKFGVEKDSVDLVLDKNLTGGIIAEFENRIYDYTLLANKKIITSFGVIKKFVDNIIQIEGLPDAHVFEIIINNIGARAVIFSLGKNIRAVRLDNGEFLPGDRVYGTGETLSVPVSNELLGRVINPFGDALDRRGPIETDKHAALEKIAPSVMQRSQVKQTLQTGITAIDALVPIGKGQRELIIGDRKTGKTSIALSAILNQKGKDVICVYVAIGQKQSNIAKILGTLSEHKALSYTVVVASGASEDAISSYLAPFSGCAVAEYFLEKGRDVLIVYDDLTKHAWSYRELSLLLGRPSGREAYPGDIFYTHAKLLERACKLSEKYGGGSITALPIIETQAGDVSTYVPTNVISITDGQLFLDSDFFNSGKRPAISVGNSVSRVGSSAQSKSMKQVAGKLRIELSQFRELEGFTQFGADIDDKTKQKITRGQFLTSLLKQETHELIAYEDIVALLWGAINGYFDNLSAHDATAFRSHFFEELRREPHLLKDISSGDGISAEVEKKLKTFVSSCVSEFKEGI